MNKNEELLPYYEKAREDLNYDRTTGIFTWRVSNSKRVKIGNFAGYLNHNGYRQIKATINGKPKHLLAHRLAWFIYYGELPNTIDHINGMKDDNKITNLRSCTHQQNSFNTGKQTNNKSGYKGVSWYNSRGSWRAQIHHNGKVIHLGYFNSAKEASEAYQTKAKELHGEFYAEKS